jgi:hypothetical protein
MTITLYKKRRRGISLWLLKRNYTPINQEREKRQQKLEKNRYNNQPQAHDEMTHEGVGGLGNKTDPVIRFSEARGGHEQEQEGVTNKK